MYTKHYNLTRYPFELKPDPDFLFLSDSHARARSYLEYTSYKWDGVAVITGEIGTGKTMLVKDLLAHLDEDVVVAHMHQTQLTDLEFLQALLMSVGIHRFDAGKVELLGVLDQYLHSQHASGRKVLLVIDEAHYLGESILKELAFLTSYEIGGELMFNFILVGQHELKQKLETPALAHLLQRVRLRFHLIEFNRNETREYIFHRLAVAGGYGPGIFSDSAVELVHRATGGVPRLINVLCDAAMVAAYASNVRKITQAEVESAIRELQWSAPEQGVSNWNQPGRKASGLGKGDYDEVTPLPVQNR